MENEVIQRKPVDYKTQLRRYQTGRMSKQEWHSYLRRLRKTKKKARKDSQFEKMPKYAAARLNKVQRLVLIELEDQNRPEKLDFAEKLRRKMTKTELKFWNAWKSQNLFGLAPQVTIRGYIVDFLAINQKIVIEFDGLSHKGREEYDRQRTLHLENAGYRVVRFTNGEVLTDVGAIISQVKALLGFKGKVRKVKAKNLMNGVWAQTEAIMQAKKN